MILRLSRNLLGKLKTSYLKTGNWFSFILWVVPGFAFIYPENVLSDIVSQLVCSVIFSLFYIKVLMPFLKLKQVRVESLK